MGVREEVTWKMSADAGEMLRSLNQTAQGLDTIAQRFEKLGQSGKRAGSDVEAGAGAAIGRWLTITKGINVATQALHAYIDANRQALRASSEAEIKQDTSFRAFRTVAKIFDEGQASKAEGTIQQSALRNKVSLDQANYAAYQLASGGIPAGELLEGGGLDAFLKMAKTLQAANPGMDLRDTARAATMFLSGTGQEMNAKGLHGLGRQMSGLFETNVELKDLEEIAAVGKGLKELGGAAPDDTLAMFSILRDTLPADEAATHFRNSVLNLATAKSEPKSRRALSKMGIKPDEVDFVGEDMQAVFSRLKAGSDSLRPEDKASVLHDIFGQKNVIGAIAAMEGVGKMPERLAMAADEGAYGRASALAMGGPASRRTAAQTAEDISLLGTGAADFETGEKDITTEMRNRGKTPFQIWTRSKLRELGKVFGSADLFDPQTGMERQLDNVLRQQSTSGPVQIEIIGPNASSQRATVRSQSALGD